MATEWSEDREGMFRNAVDDWPECMTAKDASPTGSDDYTDDPGYDR